MQPISSEDHAQRLGNVAAILIDLARRERAAQAAENGAADTRPNDGEGGSDE